MKNLTNYLKRLGVGIGLAASALTFSPQTAQAQEPTTSTQKSLVQTKRLSKIIYPGERFVYKEINKDTAEDVFYYFKENFARNFGGIIHGAGIAEYESDKTDEKIYRVDIGEIEEYKGSFPVSLSIYSRNQINQVYDTIKSYVKGVDSTEELKKTLGSPERICILSDGLYKTTDKVVNSLQDPESRLLDIKNENFIKLMRKQFPEYMGIDFRNNLKEYSRFMELFAGKFESSDLSLIKESVWGERLNRIDSNKGYNSQERLERNCCLKIIHGRTYYNVGEAYLHCEETSGSKKDLITSKNLITFLEENLGKDLSNFSEEEIKNIARKFLIKNYSSDASELINQ